MKACFQIAECSFASAKILQKSEITKRFAIFFILSPIFSCKIKIFIVSLQNEEEDKKEKRGGPERWSRKVVQKGGPETRNAILHLIASNGNITSREIANTLNINRSAILKHLKKMQEDHIIRREGSQKSGKWVVIS